MLGYLNGMRALLALWVFLGHLSAVCGTRIPVLNSNGPAVDGFMIISGFLMVYTTRQSLMVNATFQGAVQFYLVRFFRLAPLYFLMVGLVWALGTGWENMLADWHASILGDSPGFSWQGAVYSGLQEEHGVLLHLTFMHGLLPSQATSTPLSDWSLSLEMQFYLLFPLLCAAGCLSVTRAPWMAALCIVLAWVTPTYLGAYRTPGLLAHFAQPSVLLYKLNVFLCGMLLVKWFDEQRGANRHTFLWLGLSAACIVPSRPSVWVVYAFLVLMMMRPESRLARFMSSKVLAVLGDWSYAVYLIHIFTMVPVLWLLNQQVGMGQWPAGVRFFVGCLVCIPLILLMAALLYRFVERPGIGLGRKIVLGLKNG